VILMRLGWFRPVPHQAFFGQISAGARGADDVDGAHFGMTPKRYQSGEKDARCRISKIGDRGVRTALYEAADIILTRPVKAGALKSWAQDPVMGVWRLAPA